MCVIACFQAGLMFEWADWVKKITFPGVSGIIQSTKDL